jgi:hypothetical protein
MLARFSAVVVALSLLSWIARREDCIQEGHPIGFSELHEAVWGALESEAGGRGFTHFLDFSLSPPGMRQDDSKSKSPAPDVGTCTIAADSPLMGAPTPQTIRVYMDGHSLGHLGLYYPNHGDRKDFGCTRGPHAFRIEINYHAWRPYNAVCSVIPRLGT